MGTASFLNILKKGGLESAKKQTNRQTKKQEIKFKTTEDFMKRICFIVGCLKIMSKLFILHYFHVMLTYFSIR